VPAEALAGDELDRAQARLARTLERARASEDRELAGRVRDEGSQLVHQLNGLLRMCRLHSLENRAFEKPLQDLARSLARLVDLLGTLTLALVEDQVYLNEIRIRLDETQGGASELGAELLRHGLGGLRFHIAPSEAELRRLVACFAAKPDPQAPRAALKAAVRGEGLEGIDLLGRFRVRATTAGGVDADSKGGDALKRCAQAVIDSFDNLGRGRLFNPLPARRAVAELLARPGELETDPPGGFPHVAHALRVSRLALALGRELGLSHTLLQDLGVAALLHDVGYADLAQGRQPGFERHASAGARLLLRQRGFHISKVRRVRAVLGHHSPAYGRRRAPSLLSWILRVAEDYDILVERQGMAPVAALGSMQSGAGTAYHALVLQALVNVLGVCPRGSDPAPLELGELILIEPGSSPPTPPTPRTSPPEGESGQEGALSQGVPIRVIHDLHLARRSGRLTLESDAERCALHFVNGDVVAVWSSRPEHGLAALLEESGLAERAHIEEALREGAPAGHPLGRTLVALGRLEAESLEQALAAQARMLVANLVEWDEGRYRFVPDEGPQPEEDEGHSISTDGLIVGAVRALHDPDVVRFALGDLDRAPRRGSERGAAAALILGPAERGLLDRVDGVTTARRLLKDSGLPREEAERALLILMSLGLVDPPQGG
jgi:hypothetical protein